MRYGLTLTTALMGSSLLAGTALGAGFDRHGGFGASCKVLERGLERCERSAHEDCDRVEHAWRALCGPLEQIYASASAEGAAIDLLRQDYEIVPIDEAVPGVSPFHVVVGPGDLDNPITMLLVRVAYDVGKTVAIAHATQDELDRFQRIVTTHLNANCAPEGRPTAALYGVHQSTNRAPSQSSSFCLASTRDRHEALDRRWLREQFAATPPQPPAGAVAAAENQTFLKQLAEGFDCSFVLNSSLGRAQADAYVYSMRAFSAAADYYLVQNAAVFTPTRDNATFRASVRTPSQASNGQLLGEDMRILATGPSTETQAVSSYTNGKSTTVSGSVGWSQTDGFNASVGGEVTTSQATTYSVPKTTIEQTVDPVAASASWRFAPQSIGANVSFGPVTTTWVWVVPKDAYPDGGTFAPGGVPKQISFPNGTNIFYSNDNTSSFQPCNVDYPFPLWTVPEPKITEISPTIVNVNGGDFIIKGENFYQNSITAVTIGGAAVNLANNVTWKSLEQLLVTVNGQQFAPGTFQVRVNTQFNNVNRQSNAAMVQLVD